MKFQRLAPADDLIVALADLPTGALLELSPGYSVTLVEPVPARHKFAARDVREGELVTMYGVVVGRTTRDVPGGGLLTTTNLRHEAAAYSGKRGNSHWRPPDVSKWQGRQFEGFRRAQGPAGTANYWIVVPLVFCENRNLAMMREALQEALGYRVSSAYKAFASNLAAAWRTQGKLNPWEPSVGLQPGTPSRLFPRVDGVKFLEHGLGCGGTKQDAVALCGLLAGYIDHPNVAGATILSLGCQHAQISILEAELARRNPFFCKPLYIFEQQKSASEKAMLEQAIRATFGGIAMADELRRELCSLSDLILGVECGGSDGFSGLSANPVVGHTGDILAALGGAPVLSEFPELCGVEQELCDRCIRAELANKFADLMRSYAAAAAACGSGFESNPSPGNIREGLITDAMKSAGAARKGGTSPIVDVLDYPEPIRRRGGLTLYCTPGNDVESTTAIVGGGCNIVAFTTGLGTPTGNPICPTLKISTSTELAMRMGDIIDFDAGSVIQGTRSVEDLGEALFDLVVETASGRYTPKAVELGQDDFLPWKRGVSL